MNWEKLSDNKDKTLRRGSLLKFPAAYPFEDEVVMMACESPETCLKLGLITISGFKAGINCYSIFPDTARAEDGSLTIQKIYDNWRDWVWSEGSPDDAWVLLDGLSAEDLK